MCGTLHLSGELERSLSPFVVDRKYTWTHIGATLTHVGARLHQLRHANDFIATCCSVRLTFPCAGAGPRHHCGRLGGQAATDLGAAELCLGSRASHFGIRAGECRLHHLCRLRLPHAAAADRVSAVNRCVRDYTPCPTAGSATPSGLCSAVAHDRLSCGLMCPAGMASQL
jgi:hypothetical protein